MRLFRICLSAVLPAIFPFVAGAQNLNPTVEVSRQYRGSLMELDKPSVEMAVPDSVLQFNLQFDYSVFDSPFKGAYEFRPFLMDMDIAPGYVDARKLYLRAGAGYTLHPELDFVWSPVRNDKFRLSLYAQHRSYVGKYRTLGLETEGGVTGIVPDGSRFSGHDLVTEAGIDGSFDWETGVLDFRTGYYGTALKDTTVSRGYNAFDMNFGIASKQMAGNHFVYDAEAGYRYAEDIFTYTGLQKDRMSEHNLNLDVSLGGAFGSGHSFLLGIGLDYASYGGVFDSDAGNVTLGPRYLYSSGRWNLDIGAKLAFLFRSNGPDSPFMMNMAKGQIIYPDLNISFAAVKKYLDIYFAAGGGPDINPYSSLLASGRHITPLYNIVSGAPLLDNTVERVSLSVGIKGNIASRLRYDLSTGYRNFANAPLATVAAGPDRLYPGIAYDAWQMFFAKLDFAWVSQDVKIDGWLQYQSTDASRRNAALFAPPALAGKVDFQYNWKERIFFGVGCGFSTARYGSLSGMAVPEARSLKVPAFADLGISLEYAFTRKFSLWIKGGNMLDMTIQYTPLYSESGIYFTAGICLNL